MRHILWLWNGGGCHRHVVSGEHLARPMILAIRRGLRIRLEGIQQGIVGLACKFRECCEGCFYRCCCGHEAPGCSAAGAGALTLRPASWQAEGLSGETGAAGVEGLDLAHCSAIGSAKQRNWRRSMMGLSFSRAKVQWTRTGSRWNLHNDYDFAL